MLLVVPNPWFENLKSGICKNEACLGKLEQYKHLSELIISNGQEEIVLQIKSIKHYLFLPNFELWRSFLWSQEKIIKKGGIVLFEFV